MTEDSASPGSASPEPSEPATGLRERRRISTRLALEDAALRLFARDGFDATTIESIAAAAEVSTRTFHRYFAAKDEVLDMGWAQRRVRLQELTSTGSGSDLDVAAAALREMAGELDSDRDRILLRARAIGSSTALRGRTADTMGAWEAALASGLAQRRGLDAPDLAAQVAAAAAVAVWRTAIAHWLLGPAETPLTDHVDAAYAALA